MLIIVLENDPQRLARPVFVIDNQQRAFAPRLRRRLRQRRHCVYGQSAESSSNVNAVKY